MNHHLLSTASKWLTPSLSVLAFYMLFRGHNEPGGGFVGGLILGAANIFYFWSHGRFHGSDRVFWWSASWILALGLTVSWIAVLLPVFQGRAFMTGVWHGEIWLPFFGSVALGSPVYFDFGVFLVVTAVVTIIFYNFERVHD